MALFLFAHPSESIMIFLLPPQSGVSSSAVPLPMDALVSPTFTDSPTFHRPIVCSSFDGRLNGSLTPHYSTDDPSTTLSSRSLNPPPLAEKSDSKPNIEELNVGPTLLIPWTTYSGSAIAITDVTIELSHCPATREYFTEPFVCTLIVTMQLYDGKLLRFCN